MQKCKFSEIENIGLFGLNRRRNRETRISDMPTRRAHLLDLENGPRGDEMEGKQLGIARERRDSFSPCIM
jgi:hypothetical protein